MNTSVIVMRRLSIAAALLTVLFFRQPSGRTQETKEAASPAGPTLERKLTVPVKFAYQAVPFRDFVDRVAARNGLDIRLDEEAIRKAGISLEMHITAKPMTISLRSALSSTLRKYGLRFRVDGEELVIEPAPETPDEAMLLEVRRFDEEMNTIRMAETVAAQEILKVQADAVRLMEADVLRLRLVTELKRQEMINLALRLQRDRAAAPDAQAIDGEPADPRLVKLAEEALRAGLFSSQFDILVFDEGSNASGNRAALDRSLESRISLIARRYPLTDAQKRKLELAGRGDIHRLFDQIEETRQALADPTIDGNKAFSLFAETQKLQKTVSAGPFGEGSLFGRVLGTVLTPEQAAEYFRTLVGKPAEGVPALRTGERRPVDGKVPGSR